MYLSSQSETEVNPSYKGGGPGGIKTGSTVVVMLEVVVVEGVVVAPV